MQTMKTHTVGIVMNGVTGRMGMNQHLLRSVVAIIKQGGVKLGDGERIMPDPILVGRNADKLESLAARAGIVRWTTDVPSALADPHNTVYFDAQVTNLRVLGVRQAIAAGFSWRTSASTPARSRISSSWWTNPGRVSCNRRWFQRVSPCGPKKTARWLLSRP